MIRVMVAAMVLCTSWSIAGQTQEAPRYFPLEQGNAWVFLHTHTVYEGVVIKPAAIQSAVVTTDTLALRVRGTVAEWGRTYATLELDGKVWGYYRAEGNYLYKKYPDREGKLFDFTSSGDNPYQMVDTVGLPSFREIETRTLPCGVMTGYGAVIEGSVDALHEGKYLFFVDSVGPAYMAMFDAWKIPPEGDTYSLISYDVKLHPSGVREHQAPRFPELHQVMPNPFNASTVISYTLPAHSPVRITVYSITGGKVATLAEGMRSAGTHHAVLDGTGLASGVFLVRMDACGVTRTVKALLVK